MSDSKIDYADILNLELNTMISYKEYRKNREGKSVVTSQIPSAQIAGIVPENTKLGRDILSSIFGTELPDEYYAQLSAVNHHRLVLKVLSEHTDSGYSYLMLNLHPYFMEMEVQELLHVAPTEVKEASIIDPNYTKSFSDYNVGAGLLHNMLERMGD